ncbi:hypothetical protein [Burkholderia cenocepacia]|uniref:hypothetical protein n=1 Tax=Burkholderia cenocepacia TaxID=95486 RepID=UPI0007619458|nr:hypothetical protein [Burkholderia cenocepacia]KWU23447.1 hypothetical protein AS149_37290 [Burkholderia cenocepacia]
MANMQGAWAIFLDVRTTYEAEVSWWWKEPVLHDSDYHIRVNDSMEAKMKALEQKYDVKNDTRYCCQFEGMLLYGADREQVAAAGLELARHLARFKHIFPLNEAS